MSLSERLQAVRFAKGAIGYNSREVDAFMEEIRIAAERDEAAMRTLRAKLDAFEGKSAEITRTENEAYRLLAASKDEAEKIRAAAEARAAVILTDAEKRAAAAEAAAAERASLAEREAARRASEAVGNARQNAAMILAAADKRGRETLAAAAQKAEETRERAAALAACSVAFEEKLRDLTADTVRALAALNAKPPVSPAAAERAAAEPVTSAAKAADIPQTGAAAAPAAETLPDPAPIFASRPRRVDRVRSITAASAKEAAQPAAEPAASHEAVPKAEAETEPAAHDYTFAGGKLFAPEGADRPAAAPRRLYDTVRVTYDDGDGYADIKRLMDSAGERKLKNPTDFAN